VDSGDLPANHARRGERFSPAFPVGVLITAWKKNAHLCILSAFMTGSLIGQPVKVKN
jgi:hypothetical protein